VTDRELVERFEAGTLPGEAFTHRNHVRAAWLYLREWPLFEGVSRFIAALRRFAGDKYHETITMAFLLLIAERMNGHASFEEFAAAEKDLFAKPLERYYSADVLASDDARLRFAPPKYEEFR
jgi:hypothetical protein